MKLFENKDFIPEITDEGYAHKYIIDSRQQNLSIYYKSSINAEYLELINSEMNYIPPISTGLRSLDNILEGGLRNGIYIIGANPGLGKTSLMLHIASNLMKNGNKVIYFNLEMDPIQIYSRLLSNYYYKNKSDYNLGKMNINSFSKLSINEKNETFKNEFSKFYHDFTHSIYSNLTLINKTRDAYHKLKNNYADNDMCLGFSSSNVESVSNALTNAKELGFKPVIIIDYLQIMNSRFYKKDEKRSEINYVIENLKTLSSAYNVPILIVSSLSRKFYTGEIDDISENTFNMQAFKESGQIEYQADFLAILSKGKNQKIDFDSDDDSIPINLSVLKNRYGKKNDVSINLKFIPESAYYEDV